jgi:aspartokinase/homoserine dehydrogenase 1
MNEQKPAPHASPVVIKFGGSSLQDPNAVTHVQGIVRQINPRPVVVLSAMGGITDALLNGSGNAVKGQDFLQTVDDFSRRHLELIATLVPDQSARSRLEKEVETHSTELASLYQSLAVLGEISARTSDRIVARGEKLICEIMSGMLDCLGIKSQVFDPTGIIKVSGQFGTVFPDLEQTRVNARNILSGPIASGVVCIVPGFIGSDESGQLITLGRGGTDLTATILGYALDAPEVRLYKEVYGLMTADPRIVAEAKVISELHYREAAELAYYGAKILHPRSIIPLQNAKIPLIIRNTFDPDHPGTTISDEVSPGPFPVRALTAISNQALISVEGKGMIGVPGVAARTFEALARTNISVTVISQASSEASICFALPNDDSRRAVAELNQVFQLERKYGLIDDIKSLPAQAVLAIVGLGMRGTPGIAARTFKALAKAGVNIEAIAQGSSELNISVVVSQEQTKAALQSLHREFRLEKSWSIPLLPDNHVHYVNYGFGQIGRTLARQLLDQQAYLTSKLNISITCSGLTDSSGMLFDEKGITGDNLRDLCTLKEKGIKLSAATGHQFVTEGNSLRDRMFRLPFPTPILVDTSATDSFAEFLNAVRAGWHVVTANKKPMAVDQSDYDLLFSEARRNNVQVRFEATVGAGLPILDTINKLHESGDQIHTIEGCFSGTLGFLFTELEKGTPYSEAVSLAYSKGYTEPDPREDLSGMDVARKALILARSLGKKLNLGDIRIESLYTDDLSDDQPQKFLENLKRVDQAWSERIRKAEQKGAVLRYVARIGSSISVGVEEVPKGSPFGRLQGTDNQVSIVTNRYKTNPLIVTGPGAGADVTAAGVLNDILAIAVSAGQS